MCGGIPTVEIDTLNAYWNAFPHLRNEIFYFNDTPYSSIAVEDVAQTIQSSNDIEAYFNQFNSAFADFTDYLRKKLIFGLNHMEINANEDELSSNIFARLSSVPLVDKYEAYQILDGSWSVISADMETIQRDGFAATRCVDPNMVQKKKEGKETEIQEGWIGRILPFDLVQHYLLTSELAELKAHDDRLAEICSAYEEELDALSEEDKEADFVNEEKTGFVWAEVKKAIKAKEVEANTFAILKWVLALNEEEKKLKKQVKEESAKLHLKTKEIIETLSDDMVLQLLEYKWITPLVEALGHLPKAVVNTLSKRITALAEKYETTLNDLEADITRTEQDFCVMIDDLTGNEYDMKGLAELQKLLRG